MSKKLSGKALVVQVGEAETRVASIVLGAKYPQVLDSVVMPTPEGAVSDGAIENVEAMSGLLAEVRLQPGFKKIRKVLFVLSSTQVISQSASVPKMKNAKKLEQLVRANADMYFPVDISDYQMTWMVAGEKVVEDVPHS